MSLPKLLGICGLALFGIIFGMAFFKGGKTPSTPSPLAATAVIKSSPPKVEPVQNPIASPLTQAKPPVEVILNVTTPAPAPAPAEITIVSVPENSSTPKKTTEILPDGNRIEELFNKKSSSLKFIDTITYKSRVEWQKGRPAWLSDYASHYETSRHFMARSLNGKADYFKQDIAEGEKVNVFKKGVKLKFYLLVDTSLCKMWLYALDDTHGETTLLKTYPVCLGRVDSSKTSGLLTPMGTYSLGSRIAIYKPKIMGYHKGKKIEMVREFGSRWIPFEKEVAMATSPAKGYGLHGVPWTEKSNGDLSQDKSSIGKYESDGCIRLSTEDIEEIFAIIITKPTEIEIVRHYQDATIHKR